MTMDPRRVIKNLLGKWGIDIFLQRRIFSTGEGIYSLPDADPKNNYFTPQLERWTVRFTFAGRKTALTAIEIGRQEGSVHAVHLVFYFPWDSVPKEGDRIYVNDPRFPMNETIWLIKYAEPVTGWHGRVEYFEVGTVRERPS